MPLTTEMHVEKLQTKQQTYGSDSSLLRIMPVVQNKMEPFLLGRRLQKRANLQKKAFEQPYW